MLYGTYNKVLWLKILRKLMRGIEPADLPQFSVIVNVGMIYGYEDSFPRKFDNRTIHRAIALWRLTSKFEERICLRA